ncbi:MAG: hypothetical protein IJ849_05960 [Selenomonadaceae bacterium]|nr:hypothetical protein [Selenomonadaceae bacterium]
MMNMEATDLKKKCEKALQDLNDMKNHEADYAVINRLLNIINLFAGVIAAGELMAEELAQLQGKTAADVVQDYAAKAGL